MYNLAARVKFYWKLACEYEGYVPDETCIYVFSRDNPYRIPYITLSRQLWKERFEKKED